MAEVTCPECGAQVSPGGTLWVMLGQWFCSERCARAACPPDMMRSA